MRQRIFFAAVLLLAMPGSAQVPTTPGSDARPGDSRNAAGTQASAAAQRGVATKWTQIQTPPLPPFHPQQPKRIELPNGLVIFLQEDHELPLIDGQIRIRGGGRNLPGSKTGMMSIYGRAWRTGGTESKTGDQLDDMLEARAAKVETSGGIDSTFLSWSCLKGDFQDVFAVALDLLQHPAFREDKIALAKQQLNGAIARRNDELDGIASREATRLAYGRDNPYARIAEYSTVAAVTRDDLLAWHKRTIAPNNMMIGVVGDFDSAAMEATLRQAFGGFPRGEPMKKPLIPFQRPNPGVYFIEKSDVNQAAIRMVDLTNLERNNPDYFAVEVMDEAFFSGGFSARLMEAIRT